MFTLRNLTGQTESEQVEEATAIMAEVAAELHYITGYGIDKGTVKLNARKANEVVYSDLAPSAPVPDFWHGVKITLGYIRCYQWVSGRPQGWRIPKERFNEAWQRQIWEQNRVASFRIPCLYATQPQQRHKYFFFHVVNKKRGRKVTGWVCQYDKEDAVFNRFINRFNDEGNLAIGPERYWAKTPVHVSIEGIKWPRSKAKPKKVPRKSRLASQPQDNTDYVYLIRMGRTKFYKIGKSNDPQGRLASMQTASPYKLKIVHVFKADNAAAAEEALHHRLHEARREGEWFKLTDEHQKVLVIVTAYEDGQFVMEGIKRGIEELFSD